MEPAFSLKHQVGKQKGRSSVLTNSAFPSTAYDYLQFVQAEASKCPDVVVAEIDSNDFRQNQDVAFMEQDSVDGRGDENQENNVSLQWQDEQTAAFSELRQCLVRHRALLKKREMQKISLPAAGNESEWFLFCFGKQCSTYNTTGNLDEDNEAAAINTPANQTTEGTPALLTIICRMNQPTVLSVLDHNVTWLETRPFSLLQGQWIYALLSAVEKPLLADTTYSLRCLARLCHKQKERLTATQNDERAALYLIITLVTKYFRQTDLDAPT